MCLFSIPLPLFRVLAMMPTTSLAVPLSLLVSVVFSKSLVPRHAPVENKMEVLYIHTWRPTGCHSHSKSISKGNSNLPVEPCLVAGPWGHNNKPGLVYGSIYIYIKVNPKHFHFEISFKIKIIMFWVFFS
jgi:hypothetical protein